MAQKPVAAHNQRGVSLVGLIVVLGVLGAIAVLAMKVVPTVTEFLSVKRAINSVKVAGGSVIEMRAAFDRQADVGYIESVSGKDLVILRNGDESEISVDYQKKIPLFGPASLLIDYAATTAATKR